MTRVRSAGEGRILLIGDLHLRCQHTAALRGFSNTKEHDRRLRELWQGVVSPRDSVIVLGNFAVVDRAGTARRMAAQLPGRVSFLQGDRDPPGLGASLMELEFSARGLVVLCHYPLEAWRRRRWRSFHIHSHLQTHKVRSGPRRANVYADALGLRPMEIGEILGACDPFLGRGIGNERPGGSEAVNMCSLDAIDRFRASPRSEG